MLSWSEYALKAQKEVLQEQVEEKESFDTLQEELEVYIQTLSEELDEAYQAYAEAFCEFDPNEIETTLDDLQECCEDFVLSESDFPEDDALDEAVGMQRIKFAVGKNEFKMVNVDDKGVIHSRDKNLNGKKIDLKKLEKKMLKNKAIKAMNARDKALAKEAEKKAKADDIAFARKHGKTLAVRHAEYLSGFAQREADRAYELRDKFWSDRKDGKKWTRTEVKEIGKFLDGARHSQKDTEMWLKQSGFKDAKVMAQRIRASLAKGGRDGLYARLAAFKSLKRMDNDTKNLDKILKSARDNLKHSKKVTNTFA